MSEQTEKYLFGPVPSRRLGKSLGVDIVPLKTCTQNCIYCQLGRDGIASLERKEYVPIEDVLSELQAWLKAGLQADYITISGSGEPTLHSGLGAMIDGIHKLTKIPVAVITNGTLLSDSQVRADCGRADVVLPSLDAGDAKTYEKINRPHAGLSFEKFVDGLCQFRTEYAGPIWLEVFFCEGINTDPESIAGIGALIGRIGPDKVQVNTAIRPTAHPQAKPVQPKRLVEIAGLLGYDAEVIADFPVPPDTAAGRCSPEAVVELLRRRPCTIGDICTGLGIGRAKAEQALKQLENTGQIASAMRAGKVFYRIV